MTTATRHPNDPTWTANNVAQRRADLRAALESHMTLVNNLIEQMYDGDCDLVSVDDVLRMARGEDAR